MTGGIGSGKSTVCRLFAGLGVPVIDTDAIAHELVSPGQNALTQLAAAFGAEILDQHGRLDRTVLRERVFRDEAMRKRLEAILHPLIRERMQQQLKTLDAPYAILAIPLLVEKGWQGEVDRILVVDADEKQQLQRTVERDHVSAETVRLIMNTQVSRTQRLHAADDIINNNADLDSLTSQVAELHRRYVQLAADR